MQSLSDNTNDMHGPDCSESKSCHDARSDREIWTALKQGDQEAFIYIYSHYFSYLFNFGHQFTQDRELVKDTIQDLFIKLKTDPGNLSDTDSIKYYLFKAARRNILKAVKKQNRYESYKVTPEGFEVALSHEKLLIENQRQIEVKKHIEQAVARLTVRQREAILYYYYEGFSYAQIASIMGFSRVEYARTLIYRANDQIRNSLKDLRSTIFLPVLVSLFFY